MRYVCVHLTDYSYAYTLHINPRSLVCLIKEEKTNLFICLFIDLFGTKTNKQTKKEMTY